MQIGENNEITAQLLDNNGYEYDINDASGKKVCFYEILTPILNVTADPSIIQIDETTDIQCKVTDEDGSIAKNKKIYYYKKED